MKFTVIGLVSIIITLTGCGNNIQTNHYISTNNATFIPSRLADQSQPRPADVLQVSKEDEWQLQIVGDYFKLTTQFRESKNECLEGNQRNGSMKGAAFMDKCQNVSGQLWKIIPAGNGYFKLTTQFRESNNECFEGNQRNGSMKGAAFMDKCQNVSGQLWKIIPAGNGYFKLTTQFRESKNECLEGNQVNGSMNGAAFMDKCQNVSGQLWKVKQ